MKKRTGIKCNMRMSGMSGSICKSVETNKGSRIMEMDGPLPTQIRGKKKKKKKIVYKKGRAPRGNQCAHILIDLQLQYK